LKWTPLHAKKRERLQAAGITVPQSLFFVPIDFEQQALAAGLEHERLRLGLRRSSQIVDPL